MAQVTISRSASTAPSNYCLAGVFIVLMGGVCWSVGGILFRLMTQAGLWQIFFYRSMFLTAVMVPIILILNKGQFIAVFRRAGWNGLIAGVCLALASLAYVSALNYTTVANAAFMIGAVPLFSAVIGWILLGEKVRAPTCIAIAIAISGVAVMVSSGLKSGQILGNTLALYSALCFACYSVLLRWDRKNELTPSVFWSGAIVMIVAAAMLWFESPPGVASWISSFAINAVDLANAAVMGIIQMGLGLLLYTIGARRVQAAELGLLSLTEPVLGGFWVWLVVNEVPDRMTIIGGILIMAAITGQAIAGTRRKRVPRTL